MNLLMRRVENVLQVLADSYEDLCISETNFFKQRESFKAVNHHVLELSMLKMLCYNVVPLPFVMIGGVFGMNVTVPWQNFIDDPAELFNPENLYKEAADQGV